MRGVRGVPRLRRRADRRRARETSMVVPGAQAALDLGVCMSTRCMDECFVSREECDVCTVRECPSLVDACEGRGPVFRLDDPVYESWDVQGCQSECAADDLRCLERCYFEGGEDARQSYWEQVHLLWGLCRQPCESPEAAHYECGNCLRVRLGSWGGCEGLTGVALCHCATHDIGARSRM